jgi:predicted transcriptional regulator of viral defense system
MQQDSPRFAHLADYVDFLQRRGRYTFTKLEAQTHLHVSEAALKLAANRLAKKRRIVSPKRGFFVIVPEEYQLSGAPPATWYIDDLMKFLGKPYYVALLSAAALHGAAHQQPQLFQVMTTLPIRPIRVGKQWIQLYVKKDLSETPTEKVKGATGFFPTSTPEATALDLIRYTSPAGHTATVIHELKERMSPTRLLALVKAKGEVASVQRLGYLLDYLKYDELAAPLHKWLAKHHPKPVPLVPTRKINGKPKTDKKWSVVLNEDIEMDQ